MDVLILANGDPPEAGFAREVAAAHELLLATDGAANCAVRLGIVPNVISGDFDSVDLASAQAAFPSAEIVPTPDQEMTDLEKAIRLAFGRGATAITILGATGGRIDHTLAAFALLQLYGDNGRVCVVDERSRVTAAGHTDGRCGSLRLRTAPGDTISLLSPSGMASVTLTGVRWPLASEPLALGSRGISNEALGDEVGVEVEGGVVLVCQIRR